MSRLTRDGTAEPVSRDQTPRHVRGQGNINFPISADHEQDWQPYPVDPYSAMCNDHTYIPVVSTYVFMYSIWMFVQHFQQSCCCCCCCLHIKNRSDLYPVPFSFLLFKAKKRISVVTS